MKLIFLPVLIIKAGITKKTTHEWEKKNMKKIINIALSFAYLTAFIAGISWAQANSKALTVTKLHSTPEYFVQSQIGNKVKLIFDDALMSGTDAACERTEKIIKNLVMRGQQERTNGFAAPHGSP